MPFGTWKLEKEFCEGASFLFPLLFNAYTFPFFVLGSKRKNLSLSLLSVWEKKTSPPMSLVVRAPFFFVLFWKVTFHQHCHSNFNLLPSFLTHFAQIPWKDHWIYRECIHYNKMCPYMLSDFTRFWVNSLAVVNGDQWRSNEFTGLVNGD